MSGAASTVAESAGYIHASNADVVAGVKGAGHLVGIFVASAAGATLQVFDSLTASGTPITGAFTPALGWNTLPFQFGTGLSIAHTGTIDYTVAASPD
jgi:hypothetical protein